MAPLLFALISSGAVFKRAMLVYGALRMQSCSVYSAGCR